MPEPTTPQLTKKAREFVLTSGLYKNPSKARTFIEALANQVEQLQTDNQRLAARLKEWQEGLAATTLAEAALKHAAALNTPTTSQLTESDVEAIEARADAATEGPWDWTYHPSREGVIALESAPLYKDVLLCTGNDGEAWGEITEDDARFIKHARTDIPALIRDWRALKAELERAHLARSALERFDEVQKANKRAVAENAALREQLAEETTRADDNFTAYDRIKTLYSDAVNQLKEARVAAFREAIEIIGGVEETDPECNTWTTDCIRALEAATTKQPTEVKEGDDG